MTLRGHESAERAAKAPSVKVPLVVQSNTIHRLIAALLLAAMQAWDAYRLYFGWDDDEWKNDVVPVRQRMVTLATWLQSIDESA